MIQHKIKIFKTNKRGKLVLSEKIDCNQHIKKIKKILTEKLTDQYFVISMIRDPEWKWNFSTGRVNRLKCLHKNTKILGTFNLLIIHHSGKNPLFKLYGDMKYIFFDSVNMHSLDDLTGKTTVRLYFHLPSIESFRILTEEEFVLIKLGMLDI